MNLVEILVTAKDLTEPAFASAHGRSKGLADTMGKMGAVAGAALVGMGVEAVKMAASYESATTRLVTSAGEQQSNLDMVRKGMLQMSGQVGVSADKLAEAMYYVEAAGYHGAQGLTVLKAAAQGAAAEGADTTHVAQALTDVLKDYHLPASQAADVTSKMIAAVSHGKTNLEDYAKSFASIVPAASAAGISFNDVGAALSEMTNHGFTAQRASQNLAQALRSMEKPTNTMKAAYKEFGGSIGTLKEKLNGPNGLTDGMAYASQLAEHAGKVGTPAYAAALTRLMGTAAGANAALATTGENTKDTTATMKAMAGATADAQGRVAGFALVQKTSGQQWKELQATFDAFMITLGSKVLPYLNDLMQLFTSHQGTLDTVLTWGIKILGVFAAYKLAVEGITLVTKGWAVAQAILNLDLEANPIGLIATLLVAVGVAFYEAWKHSEAFRRIMTQLAMVLGNQVLSAIQAIIPGLKRLFDAWIGTLDGMAHGVADLVGVIPGIGGAAKGVAHMLDGLKSSGDSTFNALEDLTAKAKAGLDNLTGERLLKMNISDWQAKIAAAQKQLNSVPPSKQVQLLASIAALQSKVADAQAQIDALHGKTVTINYQGVYSGPGAPDPKYGHIGFAAGGVVGAAASGGARNGMVLVGEQGPELVKLPSGSYVHPAGQTRQMLAAGGGGGAQRLLIEWVGSSGGDELMALLRKNIRITFGGDVQRALGQGY